MTEQSEPYVVSFYCDPCARRSGRRRLLGGAEQNPAIYGGWAIWVTRRVGHVPRPREDPVGNDGGVPHGDFPEPAARAPGKRLVMIQIHPLTPAAQLICRRCPARPREARTALVELAEQAVAAGRCDAYV
jgi:hypothetical protein